MFFKFNVCRTDTVLLTTHVWPMDPQTKTTCVIYATQPSQNMNGIIMKVQENNYHIVFIYK